MISMQWKFSFIYCVLNDPSYSEHSSGGWDALFWFRILMRFNFSYNLRGRKDQSLVLMWHIDSCLCGVYSILFWCSAFDTGFDTNLPILVLGWSKHLLRSCCNFISFSFLRRFATICHFTSSFSHSDLDNVEAGQGVPSDNLFVLLINCIEERNPSLHVWQGFEKCVSIDEIQVVYTRKLSCISECYTEVECEISNV